LRKPRNRDMSVKLRRSPGRSATEFSIGTEKTGKDGANWVVKANKNGIKRWVKTAIDPKKKEMMNKYIVELKGRLVDTESVEVKNRKIIEHSRPYDFKENGKKGLAIVLDSAGYLGIGQNSIVCVRGIKVSKNHAFVTVDSTLDLVTMKNAAKYTYGDAAPDGWMSGDIYITQNEELYLKVVSVKNIDKIK